MTSISSLVCDSRLKVPPLLHGIDGLRRLFVHLDLLFADEEQIFNAVVPTCPERRPMTRRQSMNVTGWVLMEPVSSKIKSTFDKAYVRYRDCYSMKSKGLYITFLTLFLLATTFSGCRRLSISDLQDELQPICHGDDAVILRSSYSYYVSNGEIIYLKKENSQWKLCQTIDLSPYLRGCHICHLRDQERDENRLAIRSFAYNDKWLAIMVIRRGSHLMGTFDSYRVLLFKKGGDQWLFYKRFSLPDYNLIGEQVAISHDCLLVRVNRNIMGKRHINLCCFDLYDSKLSLKQELAPPWNVREQDMNSNPKFFIRDDQMLVSWRRRLSDEEELKYFGELSYNGEFTEELVLYRWNNSQWEQVQNLSELYPEDALLKCYGKPIDKIQKVDWGQNELYVLTACYGSVWKFVKNEDQRWDFAERVIGNPIDEKTGLPVTILDCADHPDRRLV